MLTKTQPRSCEEFIRNLRRSNLIERGKLDTLLAGFTAKRPRAEPKHLAEYLLEKQLLTPFQAERLIKGDSTEMVLNAYVLVDDIGSGSMGAVYRAFCKTNDKEYAIKVLPRRSTWNVRLAKKHVRAFAQFEHPAVVRFADVGTAGGIHYLVWPFVQGQSLELVVKRERNLPPGLAAHYGLLIASALVAVHGNRLFHGLLKPSNVLVTEDHNLHILDFGIGAIIAENKEEEANLISTNGMVNLLNSGLDCGSPESILDPSNRTPAGDQYSLGCLLYYCLTGRYPFNGNAIDKMKAHHAKEATPILELNINVPTQLVDIVERLMQKKPADRYRDMGEVMEALRPLASLPAPETEETEPKLTPTAVLKLPTRQDLLRRSAAHVEEEAPEPVIDEQATDEYAAAETAAAGPEEQPRRRRKLLSPVTMVAGLLGVAAVAGVAAWMFLLR